MRIVLIFITDCIDSFSSSGKLSIVSTVFQLWKIIDTTDSAIVWKTTIENINSLKLSPMEQPIFSLSLPSP